MGLLPNIEIEHLSGVNINNNLVIKDAVRRPLGLTRNLASGFTVAELQVKQSVFTPDMLDGDLPRKGLSFRLSSEPCGYAPIPQFGDTVFTVVNASYTDLVYYSLTCTMQSTPIQDTEARPLNPASPARH
jgi:hypothetical protein